MLPKLDISVFLSSDDDRLGLIELIYVRGSVDINIMGISGYLRVNAHST